MATATVVCVTKAPVSDPDKVSTYELGCALVESESWPDEIDALPDKHPAIDAWMDMRDEAIEEIAPAVARLVDEAIQRRLPWTWEGGER